MADEEKDKKEEAETENKDIKLKSFRPDIKDMVEDEEDKD